MSIENTTLYYRDGSSDKVYQAAIEERDGGFVVSFAFGRRGSTLTTGVKTAAPVALSAAKKIYDKLVNEKKAKVTRPAKRALRTSILTKSSAPPGFIASCSTLSTTPSWNG